MTSRLRIAARAAAGVAAAMAAALALASPAQAIPAPPVANWLTCPGLATPAGALSSVTVVSTSGLMNMVMVQGQITPCRTPDADTVFGVAVYSNSSARAKVMGYTAGAATSVFALTIPVTTGLNGALCLVSGAHTRLDCVGFSWAETGIPLQVTGHISTSDPRVWNSVTSVTYAIQKPGCPTCWT